MDTVNLPKIRPATNPSVSQSLEATTANDAVDRKRDEISSVAKKFEALMLHTMLKSMRATIIEDELTGSNGQDMYRDMMDQEIARNISESGGFGIQAVLAQQLGANMGVDTVVQTPSTTTSTETGSTATSSKLAQLQHYQKMSGANDLMFNTQSSLID